MAPRQQLSSDEYLRYGAECRRLARLSRRPKDAVTDRAGSSPKTADWLVHVWTRMSFADRPLKTAASWGHR
jgi:hypothetical protein